MQNAPSEGYRRGVGIVLLNGRSEVFVGRRIGLKNAWQMPQGGIDEDETPLQAAFRELKEEIGTANVGFIAESRGWFSYDVPPKLIPRSWNKNWKGQSQKWIVMLFSGDDTEINLSTGQPEFDAWRWTDVARLSHIAPPFKRQLYLDVIGEFAHVFRD